MKSVISRIAIALVIASLTGSSALAAKGRKESLMLDSAMKVNGTLLKKGNYDIKLEEETGQLSILKNGKVVAQANVATEKRSSKASRTEIRSTGQGDDRSLVSVTFGGSDTNLVLRDTQASN